MGYAINTEGRQVYDTFALPSACLCHHTQNFLLTRSNFSPELQCVPPAPLDVPDDKIHFPEMNQSEIPTPYCGDQTFCEEEQSYPNTTILWELNQNPDLSNTLFLQLFDSQCQGNEIGTRGSFSIGEEQLCIGSTKVVLPKVAKNLKEEWRYVVNIENYTQSFEVEECHNRTHLRDVPIQGNQDNDYGSCMYSGSDGDNPEFTSCRQLYTEHKLLSLTTEGQLEVDSFMLPSACACYVSKDIDFIEFRIGIVGNTVSNSSLEEKGEDE